MQSAFEIELTNLYNDLDALSKDSNEALIEVQKINKYIIERYPATIDIGDYLFSIALGYSAITITTNEAIAKYLEDIHKAASGAGGDYDVFQTILGKMLYHKGDHIDAVEKNFKNRKGENAFGLFHRLLWGHDVLSAGNDNPFILMIKQRGLSGIIQAFQHLIADTASRQGLPLPGSSYLDFEKENGTISNYLIKISESLSEECYGNKRYAQEIYSHMFTLRASDQTGNVLIESMTYGYYKLRNIDNSIRQRQIKLIAYIIAFLGHSLIGASRQEGIPYINTTEFAGMVRNFLGLYSESWKDTKELCDRTVFCIDESERLLKEVDITERYICDYEDKSGYQSELENGQKNVERLIGFWKSEDQ